MMHEEENNGFEIDQIIKQGGWDNLPSLDQSGSADNDNATPIMMMDLPASDEDDDGDIGEVSAFGVSRGGGGLLSSWSKKKKVTVAVIAASAFLFVVGLGAGLGSKNSKSTNVSMAMTFEQCMDQLNGKDLEDISSGVDEAETIPPPTKSIVAAEMLLTLIPSWEPTTPFPTRPTEEDQASSGAFGYEAYLNEDPVLDMSNDFRPMNPDTEDEDGPIRNRRHRRQLVKKTEEVDNAKGEGKRNNGDTMIKQNVQRLGTSASKKPVRNLNSSKAGKQSSAGFTSKGKGVTLSAECQDILAGYHTKSNKSTSTKGCTTSSKSGKSGGSKGNNSMSYSGKQTTTTANTSNKMSYSSGKMMSTKSTTKTTSSNKTSMSYYGKAGKKSGGSLTSKSGKSECAEPTSTPTSTPTFTPTSNPTKTPSSTPTGTPTSTPTSSPSCPPIESYLNLFSNAGKDTQLQFSAQNANFRYEVQPWSGGDFTQEEVGGVQFIVGTYTGFNSTTNIASFSGGTFCGPIGADRSGEAKFIEDCTTNDAVNTEAREPSTCKYEMDVRICTC